MSNPDSQKSPKAEEKTAYGETKIPENFDPRRKTSKLWM